MPQLRRTSFHHIHSAFESASSQWQQLSPSTLQKYILRHGIHHTLMVGRNKEALLLMNSYKYRFYRLHLLHQEIYFILKDILSLIASDIDKNTRNLFLEMKSFQHLLVQGTSEWSAGLIYLQLTEERVSGQETEAEACAQEVQQSLFGNVEKTEGITAFPLFSNVVVMGQEILFSCFVDPEIVLFVCRHSHKQKIVFLWSLQSSSIIYSEQIPYDYECLGIENQHLLFQDKQTQIRSPIGLDQVFPNFLYHQPIENEIPVSIANLITASHTKSRGESLINRQMKNYFVEDFWINTDCDGAIRIVHHEKELRTIVLGDFNTHYWDYKEGKILVSVHSQPNQIYVLRCAEFTQLRSDCFWEYQNGYLHVHQGIEIVTEGLFVLSEEQFITTTWEGFYQNGELLVLELYELYDDGTFECINEAEQSIFYPLSGVALRENGWVSIYGESGNERVWWDKEDEVILDPADVFTDLPPIVASEMKYMEGVDAVANFTNTDLSCTIEENYLSIIDRASSKRYRWFFDRKPSFAEPIRNDAIVVLQSSRVSVLKR